MNTLTSFEKLIKEHDENGDDFGQSPDGKALLDEFLEKFPIKSLETITKEQYSLGTESSKESFCYWIETKLIKFGNIKGSTATRFGVYYGKYGNDKEDKWRWTEWTNADFNKIRDELNLLLIAGNDMDFDAIETNRLSLMFKGKILTTYFPDKYLNAYSYEHVKYFLKRFGIYEYPPLEKAKQELLRIKNSNSTMREWSNLKFANFLYTYFSEVRHMSDKMIKEETPEVANKELRLVDFSGQYIKKLNPEPGNKSSSGKSVKPDYIKLAERKRCTGNEGEIAVVNYEVKRLTEAGKADLAKLVERVSEKDDSLGYDVRSFKEDGSEIHIEVKTTSGSKSSDVDFYLTDNELEKMWNDPSYEIYFIRGIYGKNPEIEPLDIEQIRNKFDKFAKPVLYRLRFTKD